MFFAISISLFDALTVAPLLSGYFAGSGKKDNNFVVKSFERLQSFLERGYGSVIRFSLNHPLFIILITLAVFIGSVYAFGTVKKTFQPDPDEGEFLINLQLPPDTSLNGSYETALKIAEELKSLPELDFFTLQAGKRPGAGQCSFHRNVRCPQRRANARHGWDKAGAEKNSREIQLCQAGC